MADEPHPDARAFLEQFEEAPDFNDFPPDEARVFHRDVSIPSGEPEPVAEVHDVAIRGDGHGLPLRVYVPASNEQAGDEPAYDEQAGDGTTGDGGVGDEPAGDGSIPVLVWAHGGGFVLGDLDTEDPTCRALANAAGCVVISVDYRLAPEHPFPAALRDVHAATTWASEAADEVGGDPNRLAIGGASAGGNLAAGVARLSRDRDEPAIDYQVLVYPVTSYAREYPSRKTYDGYFPTREAMNWFDEQYFADPLHGHNPYAYPLSASDHADLPPATVVTAGFDLLQDEGEAYADALSAAGVPVIQRHYEDTIHGFFGKVQEPEWDRAREAVAAVGDDLRARLG